MCPGSSDSTAERFHTFRSEDEDLGRGVGVLEAFLSAAPAGLALFDNELRCVEINEALARIAGKPTAVLRGCAFDQVLPASLEPTMRDLLHGGAAVDKLPFELNGRAILGTFFPVLARDRRITGIGGILTDVTDHQRFERELRAAVDIRERVLAVVSHDLRNPLSTIELAMSTIPDTVRADKEVTRRIQIVERATKTMETLICDLLDMATIQSGTLRLHYNDESAESIVQEALDMQRPHAEERGLVLVDDTQLSGVRVRCDRARILQVLANLIGNAIKFCKRGDVITLSGHADERSLILATTDTGPGIPQEDIPHLFEPYWSTARGRQRGTGLGLYISHKIVEAHGGTIRVDSVVGTGTTFLIVLPLG